MNRPPTQILAAVSCVSIAMASLAGCGAEPLPPLSPEPTVVTSTEHQPQAPSAARQALNRDLREVYAACEQRRTRLDSEVEEARAGERGLTALAVGATIAGEALSDSSTTARNAPRPGGPEPAVPQSPAHEAEQEARVELRLINDAIDDVDGFLATHPDPDQWTEEEAAEFRGLRSEMERRCGD